METEPPNQNSAEHARHEVAGHRPGDRYVRVGRRQTAPVVRILDDPNFRQLRPGYLAATPRATAPRGFWGKVAAGVRRVLIGSPIETAHEVHERLTKVKGLAIFGSDNISSSAYATEEIMRVLLLAGAGALVLTLPLTLAVVGVLVIVVISYQQTIRAYPKGASAYLVASGELGRLPGLTAAASLLNDYVLTVSVSIAAGVAALGSAFPFFYEHRVASAVTLVALIAVGNLRGIRESGSIFAAPTYVYIISLVGLLGYGLVRAATGSLPEYTPPAGWMAHWAAESAGALSLFLILRAFASGSVGLTGTEAISDGVPAFQPPEDRNARVTLLWMAGIFGSLFLTISFLAGQIGIVPDPHEQETVLSQLTRLLVGTGWYYFLVQFATAVLLVLAANTAFADFPRLSYFLARDGYLPHLFSHRGDRLAFSTGIVVLAVVASLLLVVFGGSVTALIPLYTVGVFTAFTLSQAGMVAHWLRMRGRGWRWKLLVNGVGAAITAVVGIVVAVTKFTSGEPLFTLFGFEVHAGSWMVIALVPVLILLLQGIQRHYAHAERELMPETPTDPEQIKHTIIVPVAKLNRVALQSLAYANSINSDVTAVHMAADAAEADQFQREWEQRHAHLGRLVVIESPYRALVAPLLAYIDLVDRQEPHDTLTVVLPEFVARHWWEQLLHNQTALRLKAALLFRPGTVVTSVPYHLRGETVDLSERGRQPTGSGEDGG
jgi:amino acid transporter